MLLEGDDRSNAALLRLYTLYGIIRNASEYWQNRSGYRYVRAAAGTGTWLPTSIEKPSYADILGFFEYKSFKLIRSIALRDAVAEGTARDGRMVERGSTCMNKSMTDLQEIATELKGKVKVAKLNVDENPQISTQLGVRSIPTLMVFKDGKQVAMKTGAGPKSELLRWVTASV